MRTLTYAIAGIVLGYGYPVMCHWIEMWLYQASSILRLIIEELV